VLTCLGRVAADSLNGRARWAETLGMQLEPVQGQ